MSDNERLALIIDVRAEIDSAALCEWYCGLPERQLQYPHLAQREQEWKIRREQAELRLARLVLPREKG